MKLHKPNLPEINENNIFIPIRPWNEKEKTTDKEKEEKEEDIVANDIHIDISVVKNKKKPNLKKFSLLNQTELTDNNDKTSLVQLNNLNDERQKEVQSETVNKEEILKAVLDDKIKENKKELTKESEIIINQIINSESNNKNNENIKEADVEIADKQIDLNEIAEEAPKATGIVEKSFEDIILNPYKEEIKQHIEEECVDRNINKKIEQENKELNENNKDELQEKRAQRPEENKEAERELQKLNEDAKTTTVVEENPNSIKKVKKIEFNDEEGEEETEKITQRKSKNFLAKKKDYEKIKELKNKSKNAAENTIKPRISANTGARKLIFDEEEE